MSFKGKVYQFSAPNGEFGAPNDIKYNLSHSIFMANPIALRLLMVLLYSTHKVLFQLLGFGHTIRFLSLLNEGHYVVSYGLYGCSYPLTHNTCFYSLIPSQRIPKLFLSRFIYSCSWLVLSLLSYGCIHSLVFNSNNTFL